MIFEECKKIRARLKALMKYSKSLQMWFKLSSAPFSIQGSTPVYRTWKVSLDYPSLDRI